jgi:hypothetical protein
MKALEIRTAREMRAPTYRPRRPTLLERINAANAVWRSREPERERGLELER